MNRTTVPVKVVVHAASGHVHQWNFDAASEASITATRRAIRQSRHTPGLGLNSDEMNWALDEVRRLTICRVGPLKAFYQLFGTPADHDAAIQALTEDGE